MTAPLAIAYLVMSLSVQPKPQTVWLRWDDDGCGSWLVEESETLNGRFAPFATVTRPQLEISVTKQQDFFRVWKSEAGFESFNP